MPFLVQPYAIKEYLDLLRRSRHENGNRGSSGKARPCFYVARNTASATPLLKEALRLGIPTKKVSTMQINQILHDSSKMNLSVRHRGFMLETPALEHSLSNTSNLTQTNRYLSNIKEFFESLKQKKSPKTLVLILDHLQDPHNLGAVLRTAEQFAVDLVVTPNHSSVQGTSTVANVSTGALYRVPVLWVSHLSQVVEALKKQDFWIYGATLGSKTQALQKINFPPKTALMMGGEGKGLSSLSQKICDELISIETQGHLGSLNVSVATGILLYQIRKQLGNL